MPAVSGHQAVGVAGERDLQEGTVERVGEIGVDRVGRNEDPLPFDELEEVPHIEPVEGELRARQNRPVLRDDPIVEEESQTSVEQPIDDPARRAVGIEETRHQDVGVEDDSQAERRRRRTARISASI